MGLSVQAHATAGRADKPQEHTALAPVGNRGEQSARLPDSVPSTAAGRLAQDGQAGFSASLLPPPLCLGLPLGAKSQPSSE